MHQSKLFHLFLVVFALASVTTNLVQARSETHLSPQQTQPAAALDTNFPTTAAETFKIEVNEDGIYKITPTDLTNAGMNVAAVNPNTIEMMYRGQSLAYKFVGNTDTTFDNDEYILFYGWAFDGSRTEKQYINNNVFWLWAGGAPKRINSTANSDEGEPVTSLVTAVTKEPENLFTSTYTNQWDSFPNEPDSWYWDLVRQGDLGVPATKTYQVDLPHLTTVGPATTATYTVEMLSREKSTNVTSIYYLIYANINDYAVAGQASWTGVKSINITDTIPLSELNPGTNNVQLSFNSTSNEALIYLNRITVEYQRQLAADADELIFSDNVGGTRQLRVSNFTENNPAKTLVWNITDPTTPIDISGIDIVVDGSTYEYRIGSSHAAGTQFIATTTANVRTPLNISKYVPTSLEPSGSGADWIAISHANFITQANTLADHRSSFSKLQTKVVDIEDIINQYGYGFHLPSAIRDYLRHTLSWGIKPGYVVIFGAANYNPRNLDCADPTCNFRLTVWDKNQPTFVVTDLVYEDRFQGQIPSDHSLVLLQNDDLIADMAIGRIVAETAVQAETAVAKIIKYEQNLAAAVPWQQNILFVADNADGGGDFPLENQLTADNHIPGGYNTTQLVLDPANVSALRSAMFSDINGTGVSILNYRGHGAPDLWASEKILDTSSGSKDLWLNIGKPVVILSADCLDGNFAFPGLDALSSTLLTLKTGLEPVGAAAFWSSTGLGYTGEHSALHQGFYDGLFQQNLSTIGDAINYAKLIYNQDGYDDSEIFSFLLQGDPAMKMVLVDNYEVYLPLIIR